MFIYKVVYTCVLIATLQYSARIPMTTAVRPIMEVYNVTCSKYTERIKRVECEFQKIALSRYGFNLRMMFDRDLSKTFQVRVWCDIAPKTTKRAIRILDIKLNACSFLKHMTNNLLLKSILNEFKRSTNLPSTCPFKGNILYIQDNYTLTGDILPSSFPIFNFTFTVDLFERNKQMGKWQVIGAKVN